MMQCKCVVFDINLEWFKIKPKNKKNVTVICLWLLIRSFNVKVASFNTWWWWWNRKTKIVNTVGTFYILSCLDVFFFSFFFIIIQNWIAEFARLGIVHYKQLKQLKRSSTFQILPNRYGQHHKLNNRSIENSLPLLFSITFTQ